MCVRTYRRKSRAIPGLRAKRQNYDIERQEQRDNSGVSSGLKTWKSEQIRSAYLLSQAFCSNPT